MMKPAVTTQENQSIATIPSVKDDIIMKSPPRRKRQRKIIIRKKVHFADEDEDEDNEKHMTNNMVNDENSKRNNKGMPKRKELPAGLTLASCEELWYHNKEIESFKLATRDLTLFGKRRDDDDLSGLERFTMERSNLKRNSIRYVLLAQMQQKQQQEQNQHQQKGRRESESTEFIREVSRKCSTWAVDTALVQGFKDFCEVYDPLASLFGGNIMCNSSSSSKMINFNECFFSDEAQHDYSSSSSSNNDSTSKRNSFVNSNHPVARLKRRRKSTSSSSRNGRDSFSQTFDLAQIYHATNSGTGTDDVGRRHHGVKSPIRILQAN